MSLCDCEQIAEKSVRKEPARMKQVINKSKHRPLDQPDKVRYRQSGFYDDPRNDQLATHTEANECCLLVSFWMIDIIKAALQTFKRQINWNYEN